MGRLIIFGMIHGMVMVHLHCNFSAIYAKIKNDRITLAQVWNASNIKLHLRRSVTVMRIEKNQLYSLLQSIQFSDHVHFISFLIWWVFILL
jgi:hypothetical protein